MEDERGRERGGDAAQQKTPRPECEESRPLSVEVRSGARARVRGGLARSPAPSQSGRASSASRGRRSGGKFRVRIPRKHSARAGALPFHQPRGADWLGSLQRPPSPPDAAASLSGFSDSLCLPSPRRPTALCTPRCICSRDDPPPVFPRPLLSRPPATTGFLSDLLLPHGMGKIRR